MKIKNQRRRRRKKSRFHRGVHVSIKAGNCSYRSGWELAFMKYLDECDNVVSYEYEKLIIEYVSNVRSGKKRKYFPDFVVKYVDNTVDVIEIKQQRRLHHLTTIKKANAAREWCTANYATYKIYTEIELKSLGVL